MTRIKPILLGGFIWWGASKLVERSLHSDEKRSPQRHDASRLGQPESRETTGLDAAVRR